jgi:hypothetical protein
MPSPCAGAVLALEKLSVSLSLFGARGRVGVRSEMEACVDLGDRARTRAIQ